MLDSRIILMNPITIMTIILAMITSMQSSISSRSLASIRRVPSSSLANLMQGNIFPIWQGLSISIISRRLLPSIWRALWLEMESWISIHWRIVRLTIFSTDPSSIQKLNHTGITHVNSIQILLDAGSSRSNSLRISKKSIHIMFIVIATITIPSCLNRRNTKPSNRSS